MRLGLDAMGGDFAPSATVAGAVLACNELPDNITVVLFGNEDKISNELKKYSYPGKKLEIVHTTEVLEMGDHPAKAFQAKKDSSITVGFTHLKAGKIDAFASAGNTGAMMVGAMYAVKAIPGVLRPCISAPLPKLGLDKPTIVLDVGINSDCKPDVLYQYGTIGSLWAENFYGIKNPKVGLLNIGEENEKGNLLTKATHELMKDTREFNFIGNIESKVMFSDKVDVVVCDGFTGNIVLKLCESYYNISKDIGIDHPFFNGFNYEQQGGTPVLGVNAPIVIGHGISNDIAIKNLVAKSMNIVETGFIEKLKLAFK